MWMFHLVRTRLRNRAPPHSIGGLYGLLVVFGFTDKASVGSTDNGQVGQKDESTLEFIMEI